MSATAMPATWRAWWPALARLAREHGAALGLAALLLFNALATPNFVAVATARNILLQVAPVALVAVGMVLVLATGGVDLSVGSVMAVASAVAVLAAGHGAAAAVAAGLAAALALGALNGAAVAWLHVEPFLVTLALLIAGRGLAQVICNEGRLLAVSGPAFLAIGQAELAGVPAPVLLAAAAAAGALFLLRATVPGRYILAAGGNPSAAHAAGVPVAATRFSVYLASGLLAGLAGLVETARLGATDPSNFGAGMEFPAIFSSVLGGNSLWGGRANVSGAVCGALLLAVLGATFNMLLVPFAWALLAQAAAVLFVVALQRPKEG